MEYRTLNEQKRSGGTQKPDSNAKNSNVYNSTTRSSTTRPMISQTTQMSAVPSSRDSTPTAGHAFRSQVPQVKTAQHDPAAVSRQQQSTSGHQSNATSHQQVATLNKHIADLQKELFATKSQLQMEKSWSCLLREELDTLKATRAAELRHESALRQEVHDGTASIMLKVGKLSIADASTTSETTRTATLPKTRDPHVDAHEKLKKIVKERSKPVVTDQFEDWLHVDGDDLT